MQDFNEHIIAKYTNGNIRSEQYFLNGKYHRIDRPANIYYYKSGNVRYEHYSLNGNYHRVDKPAIVHYYENGNISYEKYYILGKEITKEDFNTPGFVDSFILEHS